MRDFRLVLALLFLPVVELATGHQEFAFCSSRSLLTKSGNGTMSLGCCCLRRMNHEHDKKNVQEALQSMARLLIIAERRSLFLRRSNAHKMDSLNTASSFLSNDMMHALPFFKQRSRHHPRTTCLDAVRILQRFVDTWYDRYVTVCVSTTVSTALFIHSFYDHDYVHYSRYEQPRRCFIAEPLQAMGGNGGRGGNAWREGGGGGGGDWSDESVGLYIGSDDDSSEDKSVKQVFVTGAPSP
jgi:hypothetical protein